MSLSPLRVARDALRGAAFFVVGAHAAARADATGLSSSIGSTMTGWELFVIGLIGFIVFIMVIWAVASIPTRGWGPAALVFVSAIGLAYADEIRDALIG